MGMSKANTSLIYLPEINAIKLLSHLIKISYLLNRKYVKYDSRFPC